MPCRIPSHIYDIDQTSADRLWRRVVRRRRAIHLGYMGIGLVIGVGMLVVQTMIAHRPI